MQQTFNQSEKVANMHPRKALVYVLCIAIGILASVVMYLFNLQDNERNKCAEEKMSITLSYTKKIDSIRVDYINKVEAKNAELEKLKDKAVEKLNTK